LAQRPNDESAIKAGELPNEITRQTTDPTGSTERGRYRQIGLQVQELTKEVAERLISLFGKASL
jgi:hypothetical protein